MHTIQIDSDVFAVLQKSAQPFIDTPNSTLRRLLGVDHMPPVTESATPPSHDTFEQLLQESMQRAERSRTKAPKADLKHLVKLGFIKEGEQLFLVNYQNTVVPDQVATVVGSLLNYKGKEYSMSRLAQVLLQKVGYRSNDVRGPSHWATAEGITVTSLWEKHLEQK